MERFYKDYFLIRRLWSVMHMHIRSVRVTSPSARAGSGSSIRARYRSRSLADTMKNCLLAAAADGRTARRGEWERERHEGHKGRSENNTCALSGPPLFRPNRDGNANESRKPIRALGRESGGDGDIPSGERREGG